MEKNIYGTPLQVLLRTLAVYVSPFHCFRQCINARVVFDDFSSALNSATSRVIRQFCCNKYIPYWKRNGLITSRSQYMSTCACHKMCCSNVLFVYCSTLPSTRFSTSFVSFLKNVHVVVIGDLCTSLRRFLEMKMHYRKHVSCRKRFTLLRWKTTVYRKSARPALLRRTQTWVK